MRLRSIPPANRRSHSLACLSSMRAATHIGMTFVGAQAGGRAGRAAPEDKFTPRVIAPDKAHQALRRAVAAAMVEKAKFWEEELARWVEDFPEAAARLAKELGV